MKTWIIKAYLAGPVHHHKSPIGCWEIAAATRQDALDSFWTFPLAADRRCAAGRRVTCQIKRSGV